jgi:hypothetical protein
MSTLLRLAQGQLNLLSTCPRKFQYVYLDRLAGPIAPDLQERMAWGRRFHLLMQQRELGLSIGPVSSDSEMYQFQLCVDALMSTASELSQPALFRESEHRRSLQWQGYLLTVIYDLVILRETAAQILDWKTYPRPLKAQRLAQGWQTRLYLFVLAETSQYAPEQISMTYWFVQPDLPAPRPQPLRFAYSLQHHQQTQQELTQQLTQLTQWLDAYQAGEPLPQIPEAAKACQSCSFAIRCQRGSQEQDIPSWEEIAALEI